MAQIRARIYAGKCAGKISSAANATRFGPSLNSVSSSVDCANRLRLLRSHMFNCARQLASLKPLQSHAKRLVAKHGHGADNIIDNSNCCTNSPNVDNMVINRSRIRAKRKVARRMIVAGSDFIIRLPTKSDLAVSARLSRSLSAFGFLRHCRYGSKTCRDSCREMFGHDRSARPSQPDSAPTSTASLQVLIASTNCDCCIRSRPIALGKIRL